MKDGGGTYKVSSAAVKMNADGSVVLLTGTVEVGQGARTALSQVVAEELGIPFDAVTVAQLDTDVTPYDVNTNASSSTVVMGLVRAARGAGLEDAKYCAMRRGFSKPNRRQLALRDGKIVGGQEPESFVRTN